MHHARRSTSGLRPLQPTESPADEVNRLRNELLRSYQNLVWEKFGPLDDRQKQRLKEIRLSLQYLKQAVDTFIANPEPRGRIDPRSRLLYATRTPLEMVLMCVHFLNIQLRQQPDALNTDQKEALWVMERSGRRLVLVTQRLWDAMKVGETQVHGKL
jgi:hypothetical protein